jgi:hypothetical protein
MTSPGVEEEILLAFAEPHVAVAMPMGFQLCAWKARG